MASHSFKPYHTLWHHLESYKFSNSLENLQGTLVLVSLQLQAFRAISREGRRLGLPSS